MKEVKCSMKIHKAKTVDTFSLGKEQYCEKRIVKL